jgi:hypothetical protein
MDSATIKDLDKQLVQGLAQFLKDQDFRRKGNTFARQTDSVTQIINIQRSRSSTSSALIVTINVGVYLGPLGIALGDAETTDDVWECHWQQRLGNLMPVHNDKWWTITTEDGARSAMREIMEMINEYALPALATVDSTDKLVQLWQSGISPGLTEIQAQRYLNALSRTRSS